MHLVASDYSAIEAVVTAMLAGEQWRIDTFNRGEDIYLVSAAKITGGSVEAYKEHAKVTGEKHPTARKSARWRSWRWALAGGSPRGASLMMARISRTMR